jgi:hypothetical protein
MGKEDLGKYPSGPRGEAPDSFQDLIRPYSLIFTVYLDYELELLWNYLGLEIG